MRALSFSQVQEIRERFSVLARYSGLPIVPDRLDGRTIVAYEGVPSLVKFAKPMVGADGELGTYACYTPSARRFAIHPVGGNGVWRTSESAIGMWVNPTSTDHATFAADCYRYLLGVENGEPFEPDFLDEPRLWPKRLTRAEDLRSARHFLSDLRPFEWVVYAQGLVGSMAVLARQVHGASWHELEWRDEHGNEVHPEPASEAEPAGLRTWRMLLDGFLTHPVAFMLDADGYRATGETVGAIAPAPILVMGVEHTGRSGWTESEPADVLIPDPGRWGRVLDALEGISETELRRAGLSGRTARAMRSGRPASPRNAAAARRLVARRALAEAGLSTDRSASCIVPDCGARLHGRKRTFCTKHATYSGKRRAKWKQEAGR